MMDDRDTNSIRDVDRTNLDTPIGIGRDYPRTDPDPLLCRLGPWISAVIIVAFVVWIWGVTL